MRPRPIDSKRDSRCLGLAAAAMLTATLVAVDATQAQERPAADVQVSALTVVAAVQPIDPTQIDLNRMGGKGPGHLEDTKEQSVAGRSHFSRIAATQASGPVTVSATFPDSEAWDGFRHSVSGAATSSCFGPDALSHEEFAVQGLLRLPFLVRAASDGACR